MASLFKSKRDMGLFNRINKEYLNKLIGTSVNIFKLSIKESPDNIYMESLNKKYMPGVMVGCLIEHDDPSYDEIGEGLIDVNQTLDVRFYRQSLKEAEIYPEMGDIIEWNHQYYEITQTIENQIVAGRTDDDDDMWNWSIECKCALQREKNVNIEHPTKHYKDQSNVEFDTFYK